MKYFLKSVILLFLSLQIYAQKNNFKLSKNRKESFYNKEIITAVNDILSPYKRLKYDTAFVELEDFSENTFFNAFITIKTLKKVNYFYIFYNPHVNYCIAELNPKNISPLNIMTIREVLTDTNFNKEDTITYFRNKSRSNFYFGIGNTDMEVWCWSTLFLKNDNIIFDYRNISSDLYDYFSTTQSRKIKPPVIIKYKWHKLK